MSGPVWTPEGQRPPVLNAVPPCRWCGRPCWLTDDHGYAAHPCCAANERRNPGSRCEGCDISERAREKWLRRTGGGVS